MASSVHSYSGALGAGGAHSKPAYREGLCELFNMERELVTGTIDLIEPEPCILDLHIDAVHFGDGPSMDDSAEGAGELHDEFLAAKVDREPALAREGHLKFAIWAEDVRPHALGEVAAREVVLLENVVGCGSCICRQIR